MEECIDLYLNYETIGLYIGCSQRKICDNNFTNDRDKK